MDKNKISIHSTARVETKRISDCAHLAVFQSTPPRGWRQDFFKLKVVSQYFNPLHREGGDEALEALAVPTWISIHSTARVETLCQFYWAVQAFYFNPLHREGGDLSKSYLYSIDTDFNPLHREGGDRTWMWHIAGM